MANPVSKILDADGRPACRCSSAQRTTGGHAGVSIDGRRVTCVRCGLRLVPNAILNPVAHLQGLRDLHAAGFRGLLASKHPPFRIADALGSALQAVRQGRLHPDDFRAMCAAHRAAHAAESVHYDNALAELARLTEAR